MIYYFLVDYGNSGSYYRFGIMTDNDKEVAMAYLQQYSNDVRYLREREFPSLHDRGVKKIPCGTIVSCTFMYDKIDTFSGRHSIALPDNRHIQYG